MAGNEKKGHTHIHTHIHDERKMNIYKALNRNKLQTNRLYSGKKRQIIMTEPTLEITKMTIEM